MSSRWRRNKRRKSKRNGASRGDEGSIVCICIPSDEQVHAGFCLSLAQMVMHTFMAEPSGLKGLTIQHVGASILPHSRYTLAKKALENHATHLLYLDSDMIFPADTLSRLLAHDKDMVAINAMSRRPPFHTTAWIAPGHQAVTTLESTGLERAWRTGFAVVMLKAEVLAGMQPPYFGLEFVPERDEFRGEDYVFFDAAKAAGFELYIDHDLSKQVQHMGGFAYNPLLKQVAAQMSQQHAEVLQANRSPGPPNELINKAGETRDSVVQ